MSAESQITKAIAETCAKYKARFATALSSEITFDGYSGKTIVMFRSVSGIKIDVIRENLASALGSQYRIMDATTSQEGLVIVIEAAPQPPQQLQATGDFTSHYDRALKHPGDYDVGNEVMDDGDHHQQKAHHQKTHHEDQRSWLSRLCCCCCFWFPSLFRCSFCCWFLWFIIAIVTPALMLMGYTILVMVGQISKDNNLVSKFLSADAAAHAQ